MHAYYYVTHYISIRTTIASIVTITITFITIIFTIATTVTITITITTTSTSSVYYYCYFSRSPSFRRPIPAQLSPGIPAQKWKSLPEQYEKMHMCNMRHLGALIWNGISGLAYLD